MTLAPGRAVGREHRTEGTPRVLAAFVWRAGHDDDGALARARTSGCPHCGAGWRRCIYLGLPLRMCVNDSCNTLLGPGAWLCDAVPITTEDGEFAFMAYEGGYLKALWHWLYHGPV